LFTIRGAAPGSRPQSFRAKGYGGLAVVRFLIRLAQYTGIALIQPFLHFLDNTSVIKGVSKALSHSWTSPNLTMAPEWGLIAVITLSYRELAHPAELKWVKGHQDKARLRNSLPLSAQLNCEADNQAGQFQTDHGIQSGPIGPFLPTTCVQLINPAVYKQIIRTFSSQHTTLANTSIKLLRRERSPIITIIIIQRNARPANAKLKPTTMHSYALPCPVANGVPTAAKQFSIMSTVFSPPVQF
jgi:hypothetical protein